MKGYADTGFLCSLYAPDLHTRRAAARMKHQALPLPFIWLHRIEFRNALRLRVFRGEISGAQRDGSLNALLADLAGGVLVAVAPALDEVLIESERLSANHSETLGTRSLDIIHVAAALVLGAGEFLSFDSRQKALAAAAGLKVPEL